MAGLVALLVQSLMQAKVCHNLTLKLFRWFLISDWCLLSYVFAYIKRSSPNCVGEGFHSRSYLTNIAYCFRVRRKPGPLVIKYALQNGCKAGYLFKDFIQNE